MPLDVMVKEFAPIIVNWFVREDFIASIAVRIPTSAMIPKAMIQMVRIALTLLDLMALKAILRFSLKRPILRYLVLSNGISVQYHKKNKSTTFLYTTENSSVNNCLPNLTGLMSVHLKEIMCIFLILYGDYPELSEKSKRNLGS